MRQRHDQRYVLRLYVAGARAASQHAIANLREICESVLADQYELHIIDVYDQPQLAASEQIVVAPTLVRESPLPERRLVGDMSDRERVLQGLDLAPHSRVSWPPTRR